MAPASQSEGLLKGLRRPVSLKQVAGRSKSEIAGDQRNTQSESVVDTNQIVFVETVTGFGTPSGAGMQQRHGTCMGQTGLGLKIPHYRIRGQSERSAAAVAHAQEVGVIDMI